MVIFCVAKAINNIFVLSVSVSIFGMKYLTLSLSLATRLFTSKIAFSYGVSKVVRSAARSLPRSQSYKGKEILHR